MKPDPRFPDRPTHPDLDRLSRAVIANDNEMRRWTGEGRGDAYLAYLAQFIDPDSLRYMASQRGAIAAEVSQNPNPELLSATWVDGFMAAATMLAQTVKDGQHR